MAKVFKYFPSKYLTAVSMGFVYLNTFTNIRSYEESEHAINDNKEGLIENYSGSYVIGKDSSPEDIERLQKANILGRFSEHHPGIHLNNVNFITSMPNAYMYCTTEIRNDDYWNKTTDSEGKRYDSAIEILDYQLFCKNIVDALVRSIEGLPKLNFSSRPCTYERTSGNLEKGNIDTGSYFNKHNIYKDQKEVRLVITCPANVQIIPKTIWVNPKDLYRVVK